MTITARQMGTARGTGAASGIRREPREVRRTNAARILGLLLAGGLVGCGERAVSTRAGSGELEGTLELTGSSTVAPLAAEIGKRFERLHPGVRVNVQTGGSSRGVADARRGLADIGMVSRDLRADEADLDAHAIARDGIAIILHASNPVASLDDGAIVGIYTGRVRNWREVGGREAPITVVNKAEGRSTLELFLAHFGLESEQIHASIVIGDNEQGIKTVAGNPDAVGYVSVGAAEHAVGRGVPLKLLPLEGVVASTETIRDGSFPLGRTLNLVTRHGRTPGRLARAFLDYARSPAVRDLVLALSFVPLHDTGTFVPQGN